MLHLSDQAKDHLRWDQNCFSEIVRVVEMGHVSEQLSKLVESNPLVNLKTY